ncbi:MAG: sigma-70 family RNA polymerase sigma factor [Baekduia sp.]
MTTAPPTARQIEIAVQTARLHAWREGQHFPAHLADVHDLRQVALEMIFRKWDRRPPSTPLTAWLNLTARSAVIDELRRLAGRRPDSPRRAAVFGMVSLDATVLVDDEDAVVTKGDTAVLATGDLAYESVEAQQRAEILEAAFAALPLDLASVAEMALIEEMTLVEIGDMIGVSESRVCQLLAKARRQLIDTLSVRLET